MSACSWVNDVTEVDPRTDMDAGAAQDSISTFSKL